MENLKSQLETAYSEYLEYKEYVVSIQEQLKKDKEELAKFSLDNMQDVELIAEKFIEVNEKPTLFQNDLMKLQLKLVTIYDVVREVVQDIPASLSEEIETYRVNNIFKIIDKKPVVVNEAQLQKIKEITKNSAMAFFKERLNQK